MRTGESTRKTKETDLRLDQSDGTGKCDIDTGVAFFDHMLEQLGKHGLFDLTVKCDGDLEVDSHHTVGHRIALGQALKRALGTRRHTPLRSFLCADG